MKYAKFENGVLTFPPRNKDNVINYCLNEEILIQDGYKPLIEAIKPNGNYKLEYVEEEDQIVEVWIDNTEEVIAEKQASFYKNFFQTSLGWIRRKPVMKDGSTKDFITDCLPVIKAAVTEEGLNGNYLIRYSIPDFGQEFTQEYVESLQDKSDITAEQFRVFYQECLQQFAQDFAG